MLTESHFIGTSCILHALQTRAQSSIETFLWAMGAKHWGQHPLYDSRRSFSCSVELTLPCLKASGFLLLRTGQLPCSTKGLPGP